MTAVEEVWRRIEGVLTRRTPRSVLILAPGSASPLKLEGAAVGIWDDLAVPATDDELIERAATRFSLPIGDVGPGVVETREALSRYGAIVTNDG